MKNTKMKGAKRLSKKLWITLVTVTMGVLIAVGGAIAGITLSSNKGGLGGGSLADAAVTGVGTSNNPLVIRTGADWQAVIDYPSTEDAPVYATLGADIIATSGGDYNTYFGTSTLNDGTEAYMYGALCVPADKYVNLDLSNKKIDRNLTTPTEYGSVMIIYGDLTISGSTSFTAPSTEKRSTLYPDTYSDSLLSSILPSSNVKVTGGMITGGWANTSFYAGGLTIRSGKVTMNSGAIAYNRVGGDPNNGISGAGYENTGCGVHLGGSFADGAAVQTPVAFFDLKGGYISLNTAITASSCDGGGMDVAQDGQLNMTGGEVSWNTIAFCSDSAWGGGIASRAASYISGGKIHHNYCQGRGGALAPHGDTLTVSNCEITDNVAGAESAIYLRGQGLFLDNVTITGNVSRHDNYTTTVDSEQAIHLMSSAAQVSLAGKVILSNNIALTADGSKATSFALNYGQMVNITGPIANTSDIYIQMNTVNDGDGNPLPPGIFTNGFDANSAGTNVSVFRSNLTRFTVGIDPATGELELRNSLPSDSWNASVRQSLEAGGANVEAAMTADFEAISNSLGSGVGFGAENDTADRYGNMRVPTGADITLDLSGHNINRGITGSAIDDGYVIKVYGSLHITGTGNVSGGNNKGNGGGIYVANGGVLYIEGGNISSNSTAGNGGGVYVEDGGMVVVRGGEVSDNYAAVDGGGIYASATAGVYMYGTPLIKENNSKENFTDNLFLAGTNKINIAGVISAGTSENYVGISLEKGLGVFTDNPTAYSVDQGRFRADNDIQCMVGTQGIEISLEPNTTITASEQWARTVQKSLDHGGASVKFNLNTNWSASGGSFGTGTGFKDGAIYVPNGAAIALNLVNGVVINRGINTSSAVNNGSVIIVGNGGSLVIRGTGTISGGNTTGNGGGVLVENGASLALRGGTIMNNKAAGNGGGVYAQSLIVSDATIQQNTATLGGGMYLTSTLTLGGNVNITNNTNDEGKANNLYLGTNKITVSSASGTQIGISKASSGSFTNGLKAADLAGVTNVFTADSSEQTLTVVNGEGYIGTKVAEPVPAFDETEGVTSMVYDGAAHAYVLNKTAIEAILGSDKAYTIVVKRFVSDEDTTGTVVTLTDPLAITKFGRYEITFTLNDGYLWASADNRGEASVTIEVEITKATVTVTQEPSISGNIFVGEAMSSVQNKVSAGFASCSSTGEANVSGTWTVSSASGVIDRGITFVDYTFTPTDESIAAYTGKIAKTPVGFAITITETSSADGSATSNVKSINVDYLSNVQVSFGFEGTTQYAYFAVVQDGEAVTEKMEISDGKGYDPFLYLTIDDTRTALTNEDARMKNINGNRSFSIGYAPRNDTKYSIYYMVPNADGQYQNYTQRGDLDLVVGNSRVYRYGADEYGLNEDGNGSPIGKTTSKVVLVNSTDETPLITFTNSNQYVIDWALTGTGANATVKGDGSTWVVVYLKGREYTVTFEPNGAKTVYYPDGTFIDGKDVSGQAIQFSFKAKYGAGIEPPVANEDMLMDGSTFQGWYTENNGGGTKITDFTTQTVDGDKKYYAYWEITSYKINYHYTDPNYTTYAYELANDDLTDYKDALRFEYEDANGITQYADFEIAKADNREYYKKTDANFNLLNPSTPGFKFEGWYDASGKKVMTITRGSMGEKHLYARWSPNKYLVTFDGNNGTVSPKTKTYTNMTAYGTLPSATRAGYTFAGWYTEAQDDGETLNDMNATFKVEPTMLAVLSGPVTLYAGWVQKTYKVTYNGSTMGSDAGGELKLYTVDSEGNEDEASVGADLPYGTKIKLTVVPASGYSIKTIKVGSVTIVNNVTRTLLDDMDVTVEYVEQTYTIRYTYNYGSAVNGESSFVKNFSLNSVNANLPNGDDVARVGYDFANWVFASGISDTGVSNTDQIKDLLEDSHEPLRNVTLVATWKAKDLHVFLHKQMSENDDVDMLDGTLDAAITVYTDVRENYELIGWATKPDSRTIALNVVTDPESADYGKATYSLKAEDYTGTDWTKSINNLYAVWHIVGSQELLLTSDATDAVYTGNEYTISATPLYSYAADSTVVLQYQWYKDGVPLTNGRITRTYADSNDLGSEWTTVEWKVKNVADSGVYECRLTATGNIGGSTYATGSGEIEINIGKAEYKNFKFEDSVGNKGVDYDGKTQNKYVMYGTPKPGGQIDYDVEAQNYIQIGTNRSDWIAVKYSAVDAEGEPVTAMKNAGVYTVTAEFTVPTNSNYLPIVSQSCTFEIKAIAITDLEFTIVSVGADGKETEVKDENEAWSFVNGYNKLAYKVKATGIQVLPGDKVEIGLSNAENTVIGNYEAAITGELTGDDAVNYVLDVVIGSTQIYSIVKADHDISNVKFDETATVTYDAKLHEVYLEITVDGQKVQVKDGEKFNDKNGFELTVKYTLSYGENHSGYVPADDVAATKNGGYAAGEYVITATFEDEDAANFNELEEKICTLTIEQRDLFDEFDKDKLLGSFQTTSLSYDPDATAKLYIDGSDGEMDFNSSLFTITYVYEKLAGSSYSEIIQGTQAEIEADAKFKGLRDSGYYRLTAKISYNVSGNDAAALALANNYAEIEDIVIDYTIANGVVDSISVTLKDGAEFWYGEAFDNKNIERIVVTYKGTDSDGNVDEQAATTTETFTDENWLNGAIIYEGSTGEDILVAFNHVGDYVVRVNFLGAEQECTVSVKQKISSVTEWQYSSNGTEWNTLPSDGIEYIAGGYLYRAVFSGAGTTAGSKLTDLTTTANVTGKSADFDTHKYLLNASETSYELWAADVGNYVLVDGEADVTGELKIKKNTQVTAQWYYGSTKIEEANIIYTGADFQNSISVRYNLGNGDLTLSWTKPDGFKMVNAGKYTLTAPQLVAAQGGSNYELQGLEIEVTVKPKEVAFITEDGYGWQYYDGESWVDLPASLDYKGADYNIRILAKDGDKDVIITVVGAPLSGGEDVAIRNAGNYRLRGANSNYTIPANQNGKDLIIQKKALTITWKYGEDDEQFVYDGKEQTLLGEVAGVGEDASAELIEITGNTGTNALDYTAEATFLGSYGDNYTLTNSTYAWEIKERNIELKWNSDEFGYTGAIQVPEITETNVVEGEEIIIRVSYKRTIAYGVKEDVELTNVVNVAEYTAVPEFDGDPAVLANYSFNDVEHVFNVIKSAPAIASVTYTEYLTNVTYQVEAGEERGLREDKLTATFNGTPVAGHFEFIDSEGNVLAGKDVDLTTTSTGTKFAYKFVPDDQENYNDYVGEVTIMVVADGVVTGKDALVIDLRIKQYVVGSGLSFVGTHAYLKYASYYEENGVRHGKLVELDLADVDFTIAGYNGTVDQYKVRPGDVPSTGFGTMTLEAELKREKRPAGYETKTFSGKTNFIVTKDEPVGMEVDWTKSEKFKTVWYVDEVFSTSGLEFKLDYGSGKQPGSMPAENVNCELNGTKFTEANAALEVEFTFLDVSTKITIEVRAREFLQVNYSNSNNLLAYEDGKDLDWKSEYGISFTEDGEEKSEIAGVSYSYIIRKRGSDNKLVQVNAINEIGVYQIEVQFIIENARYFSYVKSPVEFTIEVSELVYRMDENFEAFTADELNVVYTGEAFAFDTTRKPTVYDKNGNAVAASRVRVTYAYEGKTDSHDWNVTDVGTYEIVMTVEVNDPKLGWRALNPVTYVVTVEQATTEINTFTIGKNDGKGNYFVMEGTDVSEAIKFESTFGEASRYRYREVNKNAWTNGLPTKAGKYEVEVTVTGTDNYTTVTSTALDKNAIFEIRKNAISVVDDGNGVDVIVENGKNGIETGINLKADKVLEEDLAQIKIKKQVVLDGYDIDLVNGEGVTVQPNGDVTVKVKVGDEFADKTNLNVYLYEDGKATNVDARLEDGYLVFTTDRFNGVFAITEAAITTPGGLIAGVSVGAVVAAGLIVACVLVFLKKRGN